jgi:exosortase/archaeosortase family protein
LRLLFASSAVRLLGQVLGVNIFSALTLVVDVYALGRLLRLPQRHRPIAPFWLAVLFAFSLPFERVLQHTAGFGLQQLSAAGACAVLQLGWDKVRCEGVRIGIAGKDVLIDLPCSGARGLLLVLALFAALAALSLPKRYDAAAGFLLALMSAWMGNVLRIVTLAIGIADPDLLGGIAVMEAPWHELIGLMALVLSSLPLLIWARASGSKPAVRRTEKSDRVYIKPNMGVVRDCFMENSTPYPHPNPPPHRGRGSIRDLPRITTVNEFPGSLLPPGRGKIGMGVERLVSALTLLIRSISRTNQVSLSVHPLLAACSVIAAALVVSLPARPVDIAQPMPDPSLPLSIAGFTANKGPLTSQEQIYFTRYGGGAARASYGVNGLLLVRTSAPLRHLHGPDECLRGAGHQVRYLGSIYAPLPAAIYRSIDPEGRAWRIAVSFVSNRGETTTSVAHAVWLWLKNPGTTWTQVQRITPWEAGAEQQAEWDRAVARALDLPIALGRHDVHFAVFTQALKPESNQNKNINKNI